MDLYIGTDINIDSSALEVACGPPQELEQKFEIVLLAESAWMGLKSSANERSCTDLPPAPGFDVTRAESREQHPFEDRSM
jgi:hypothetical protein